MDELSHSYMSVGKVHLVTTLYILVTFNEH
jgi:hypothetical protein